MSISSLHHTLGSLEVGTLISTFLYGVMTVQVYLYFSGEKKDRWYIRCLVPFIWLVESFHTWSMCYYLYYLTVSNYGNPEALASGYEGDWTLNTSAFWDGLVGAVVQSFFAHRIYMLTGKWYIPLISWTGSLLALAAAFGLVILSPAVDIAGFEIHYSWLLATGLVKSLLLFVDIINTVSLCIYLRIERTGFAGTDSMLNHLFLWTLETGLITSLAATLMLIFLFALPNTTVWISISIFYAKLYSNSFMASLNARKYLLNSTMGSPMRAPVEQQMSKNNAVFLLSMQLYPHTDDPELTITQQAQVLTGDDIPMPEPKIRLSSHDVDVGIV